MPNPIMSFDEAGFPGPILAQIRKLKYEKPSPIQSQVLKLLDEPSDWTFLPHSDRSVFLCFLAINLPLSYMISSVAGMADCHERAQLCGHCQDRLGQDRVVRTACAYPHHGPAESQARRGTHCLYCGFGNICRIFLNLSLPILNPFRSLSLPPHVSSPSKSTR